MVTWQQTLLPSAIFYALAGIVALSVAAMIAGLAAILRKLEAKEGGK
jgi:hypothetical protein